MSLKTRIVAAIDRHPGWNCHQVAALVGTSASYVRVVTSRCGIKLPAASRAAA